MPRKTVDVEMVKVTISITKAQHEMLEELVKRGKFSNVTEAIRAAIRGLLRREL